MYEVGRVCVKIAGRDAGLKCIVVEVLENNLVLIDGQTRRRNCNIKHLEPLSEVIKVKKGISHAEVIKEFKKLKIETKETKPKKATVRLKKQKKKKVKPSVEETKSAEKSKKKVEKKAETKEETKAEEKTEAKPKTEAKKKEAKK
ncbi:MAG: 50S ribosomal protein L14e [archaeon]